MRFLAASLTAILYVLLTALCLAALAAFVWSVILAYLAKGFLGAAAMVFFPVLGQLFLGFLCWPSDYSTLVAGTFALLLVVGALRAATDHLTS